MFRYITLFLLIIGTISPLFSQKPLSSIIEKDYIYIPPPIHKVKNKIDKMISYHDYCGPTRETFLYFDSTGCLIAQHRGPWIRSADVPPGPTYSVVYNASNPPPSFFFTNDRSSLTANKQKYYYYNATIKKLEALPYSDLECESEGFVAAQKNNTHKYAYLNKKNIAICDFIYDRAQSFENGVAIVTKEGKKGVLNTKGVEIIPCHYQNIRILDQHKIEAQKSYQETHIFNQQGKLLKKE